MVVVWLHVVKSNDSVVALKFINMHFALYICEGGTKRQGQRGEG